MKVKPISKVTKRKMRLYYPLLKEFAKASSQSRYKAIMKMNEKCINLLCECSMNVIYNPFLTTNSQKKKLNHCLHDYKSHLQLLCCCHLCPSMRRQYCLYMRNCIGVLLNVLLPLIKNTI